MKSIQDASEGLRSRTVSSTELTRQCLSVIERRNGELNAFLTVTAERALADAAAADEAIGRGDYRGPLHGIPIALKDVFCTAGIRTTCGSLLFKDYIPENNSAVAERLATAGAVLMGKTHMHELAYGVTSNNPHFGPVRNPWNTGRVPGGSSGGSAAAVAAGMAFMAMGSDTGGSIRIPASFCNLAGLKPTHGRVSRYGVLPLDFSLDHMGPITRTVRDSAIVLQVLAGPDKRDDTASQAPVDQYVPPAGVGMAGVRVGVPREFYFERIQPAAAAAAERMIDTAKVLGAELKEIVAPDPEALITIGRVILLAEASAAMRRFDDRRAEFGEDVRALFDQGALLSAVDYINAQRLRRQLRDSYLRLFDSVDVIATPTTPIPANPIGASTVMIDDSEADFRLSATRFVRGINVLGFPAISIPCGFDEEGMPLGFQLIGKPWAEAGLLRIAAALEDATGYYKKMPAGYPG